MYPNLVTSHTSRISCTKLLSYPVIYGLLFFSQASFAKDEVNIEGELALHGYDPVSYFMDKPVPGMNSIYSLNAKVRYLFSSTANKEIFDGDPERYKPLYGGYCAYGVRMGKKLDNDPLSYEIVDDRLYVLLNRSTHKIWRQDISGNIKISDRLWPQIKTLPIESLK